MDGLSAPDRTSSPAGLPSVSVCFPAHNEQHTIGPVLEEAHRLLAGTSLDYELLVCDDGSVDRTSDIIHQAAGRLPRLRVFRHAQNRGIRETFERLYHEAVKDFVFLNSTDGQWSTAILLDMLPMTRDYDVIIANRIDKHYRPVRRFISWTFNLIPLVLFGTRTVDAGAVKLVRRELIERWTLVSRSPFTEAERLIRAARAGYRIGLHPVEVNVRAAGRERGASWRLTLAALADVARVWWALRRGR